jgi:homoserine dehydrogenase
VIELIGGEKRAVDFIRRAIDNGKHVVTANKLVMAHYGPELLERAEKRGVDIYFEASVGGGIPLIAPFKHSLIPNRYQSIKAIINGTTNYILTKMAEEGTTFEDALKQAQSLGYAEAKPESDVEGFDAAYKLAIMTSLGFQTCVHPDMIHREGITRVNPRDFRYADELGYAIKLLAIAKNAGGDDENGAVEARVHLAMVPRASLLAAVNGVFNAVQVDGDLTGTVLFYGRGAGSEPTASAVVSDVIDIAHNIKEGISNRVKLRFDRNRAIMPMSDIQTRYYLRMQITDSFGVLAQIAQVLGDRRISIASVVQKETNQTQQSAEIVVMTHSATESAMQMALNDLTRLPAVLEVSSFIRVEG